METLVNAFLEKALAETLTHIVNNPDSIVNFLGFVSDNVCHSASDVAIDAIDAYKHGKLSREQALKIVTICLESKQQTVNVTSTRLELEKLFK